MRPGDRRCVDDPDDGHRLESRAADVALAILVAMALVASLAWPAPPDGDGRRPGTEMVLWGWMPG